MWILLKGFFYNYFFSKCMNCCACVKGICVYLQLKDVMSREDVE
jgi:hypothetical protein